MKETEIVCIPGLRGRDPKEISLKTLAQIIEARMGEIVDNVYNEIRNSGFEKDLIGGIVITGGGSQLKYINQLFEYITGMDCRIGYPTEHVAKAPNQELTSPMYATGTGLVIKGFEKRVTSKREEQPAEEGGLIGDNGGMKRFMKKIKDWFEKEEE